MSVEYDLYLKRHKEGVRKASERYEEHKDIIIFSEKTRKTVEEILNKMSQILQPL